MIYITNKQTTMEYDDIFNPKMENDIDADVEDLMAYDRGYNKVYTMVTLSNGKKKRRQNQVFTSSGVKTKIRHAATGIYYTDLVGSANEDKYFKVAHSTGILKSNNNSNILFYCSPYEYMRHMNVVLDDAIIAKWESKQSML